MNEQKGNEKSFAERITKLTKGKIKIRKDNVALAIFLFCMTLPVLFNVIVFWFPINIDAIVKAFIDYNTGELTFNNFVIAFDRLTKSKGSGDLGLALSNTMKFFLVGIVNIPITLFSAYMIFKKMAGSTWVRIFLYLPGAISSLMMARLFNQFTMADGPLGNFFDMGGLSLMTNEQTALGGIIFFDMWLGLGGGLVLWFGAMGRIPPEISEYSKLEGVKPVREFLTIILPLIWPTLVTMVSLQLIGIFGASGSILIFTKGGYGTTTLSYWLYELLRAGRVSEYRIGNAVGLVMMVLTIPILIGGRMIMNKFGQEVEY